jgi:hypothetical protein
VRGLAGSATRKEERERGVAEAAAKGPRDRAGVAEAPGEGETKRSRPTCAGTGARFVREEGWIVRGEPYANECGRGPTGRLLGRLARRRGKEGGPREMTRGEALL